MQLITFIKNIILYILSQIVLFINNIFVVKLNNIITKYVIIFSVCKYIDIRFTDLISILFNYKNKVNRIIERLNSNKELQDRDIKVLVCFRYFSNRYNLIDNIFNTSIGVLEQRLYWRYINIVNGKQLSGK